MFASLTERNLDIKKARGKIPVWAVAEKLEIHENTLRNWLRKENLSVEKRIKIMAAINEIKEEMKKNEIGLTP